MATCSGCGRFVGDYSVYRIEVPGRSPLLLCYRCKRLADRNPGMTDFPAPKLRQSFEGRRVRIFSTIFIVGSLGVFALGLAILLLGRKLGLGALVILGAISLFSFGLSMRRFSDQ